MIPKISFGLLSLVPVTKDYIPELFRLRNSQAYIKLLTNRGEKISFEAFEEDFWNEIRIHRSLIFLIFYRDKSIGTIFTYDENDYDNYTFFSVFIEHPSKYPGIGIKASLLFCQYLFKVLGFYKLYIEVYSYNKSMLKILNKKLDAEGCFKRQHLWNGERHDVYRFAIFCENVKDYFVDKVILT